MNGFYIQLQVTRGRDQQMSLNLRQRDQEQEVVMSRIRYYNQAFS